MPKYEVHYAYELDESTPGPEGETFVKVKSVVDTDVPIETLEQVREVSKQLFRNNNKEDNKVLKLAVENIYNLDENGEKIELEG